MGGAAIETTLELWASSLREVKGRMRPLFDTLKFGTNLQPLTASPVDERIYFAAP